MPLALRERLDASVLVGVGCDLDIVRAGGIHGAEQAGGFMKAGDVESRARGNKKRGELWRQKKGVERLLNEIEDGRCAIEGSRHVWRTQAALAAAAACQSCMATLTYPRDTPYPFSRVM